VRTLVALLAAVLVLTGCSDGEKKERSDRLPDVSLANIVDGADPVDLDSLRGPTVVNLWASWCVPCKRELPIYAQFARAHTGRVAVIGVDFQETDAAAARALLRASRVDYPVVKDPDGKLRAIGLPELVLLDSSGRIAHREYVEITSLAQLEGIVEKHLGVDL
jgi:cytochrome c biogenesis protein CcmG, thiol:disulfide interchange protein DsbE